MVELALVLAAAVFLDFAIGDPVYRLHPVRLLGKSISGIEHILFKYHLRSYMGGGLLVFVSALISLGSYLLFRFLLQQMHPLAAIVLDIFVLYSCIAMRDLLRHAQKVIVALESGTLESSQVEVQKIVGRNASLLDRPGVARAAVESVAESYVDGFLAPLLGYVFVGFLSGSLGLVAGVSAVCAAVFYRTINTLDSMVGYQNKRYLEFGFLGAKLDDVLNFIPARLSVLSLSIGSLILGYQTRAGMISFLNDRKKHASPNSAHSESFVAGALGLRLGGPVIYFHMTKDKPWIGTGTAKATSSDILKSIRLTFLSGCISVLGFELLILSSGLIFD